MKNCGGKKILIVEDDACVHELLEFILRQKNDYVITIASDGQQALDLLEDDALPDLIFMDYMLPKVDGVEVCQRLKNNDKVKDIPVVMMSASRRLKDQCKVPMCADYCITKPFNVKEVLGIVENIFKEDLK